MKLSEYNIKTKQVYINLVKDTEITTETLSVEEALKKYGNYFVKEFEEPEVEIETMESALSVPLKKTKKVETKKYVEGTTNVVLEAF